MIYMYTGTPGSGKSLHVAKEIRSFLKMGAFIVSNFPFNTDLVKLAPDSKYIYLDNAFLLRPDGAKRVQQLFQAHRSVNQRTRCILILDECQLLFDSRGWNSPGRREWLSFFTLHRHVMRDKNSDGTIYLITQNEKAIDKRLLPLSEYYVVHRNIKYGSTSEFLLSLLFGCNLFVSHTIWRSGREMVQSKIFIGTKKLFALYDTSMIFTADGSASPPATGECLEPVAGGGAGTSASGY